MKKIVLIGFMGLFVVQMASANVAAVDYVKDAVSDKVSVNVGANQKLQGTYQVSGRLEVETPTLPADTAQ